MHFPFLIKIHEGQMEKPIILLRQHAIIFLKDIVVYLFLLALPIIAGLIIPDQVSRALEHPAGGPSILLFFFLWELFFILLFYTAFLNYYLDVWVVTDERILDINQEGVFSRSVSELELHRIQDVHAEIKGVFATLFNFGLIEVQTAGTKEKFVFDHLPNPQAVARHILELAQADAKFHDAIAGNE